MSIASEPHTPCAHERRKVSEPSDSHLTRCKHVEHTVHRLRLDAVALPMGSLVAFWVVAQDAQVDLHGAFL